MKIKFKLFLTIIAIGTLSPAVIIAHPGHGNTRSNYLHYMSDHVSNHFVWLILLAFLLVLLRVSAKNK